MWRILDLLFPLRTDERIVRDLTDDGFLQLVSPQLIEYTRPATVALLPFNDPRIRAVLHEAKYHGNEHALQLLGSALAEYLRDNDEGTKKFSVVPIPLGRERRAKRGFNQTEEILRRTGLTLTVDQGLLTRTRETISQVSLPRKQREENMRGAFGAAHPLDPSHTYIIVDDVITTGATLHAAIDALAAAGATNIIPLALAH
jgi:ComF family protein